MLTHVFLPCWSEQAAAECNALLLEDNRKDERVLRQLEKNLKMKKKKSGSLPRAFVNDGLDCIFSPLTWQRPVNE